MKARLSRAVTAAGFMIFSTELLRMATPTPPMDLL